MPDGTMIGNIFFYASPPQQSLSSSMVLDETIETFLVEPFTLTLANELNVNASDVTSAAQGGSVNLQIDVVVPKRRGVALLDQMTTLVQDTSHMNALFNTTVLSAGPVSLNGLLRPLRRPLRTHQARRRRHRRRPRRPVPTFAPKEAWTTRARPLPAPTGARRCRRTTSTCTTRRPTASICAFGSGRASRPRTTCSRGAVCEDGLLRPKRVHPGGQLLRGLWWPRLRQHHVNLSTGLIAGCGRVDLVPCGQGTDCFDCGRSATMKDIMDEYNRRPKYEPYPRRTANARRRLEEAEEVQALNVRRGVQAQSLPALHEKHEMRGLARAQDSHQLPPAQAVARSVANQGPHRLVKAAPIFR